MKTMSDSSAYLDEHVELEIPWYANGTATPAERQRVEQHIEHCARCHGSLQLELRLAALLRDQRVTLECAPQHGWRRLTDRIGPDMRVQRETVEESEPVIESHDRRIAAEAPRLSGWRSLPAVLLAQAAAIVALAIALTHLSFERENAPYSTLTNPDASHASSAPMIRVVFADETSSGRISELLAQIGGTIRAGPSAREIYTIELVSGDTQAWSPDSAAAWLREQPEVRLAEPITGGAGERFGE